jgi:hypothetical protein
MATLVEYTDRKPLGSCDPTRLGTLWRFGVLVIGWALVDEALAAEVGSMLETSFLRNVPDCYPHVPSVGVRIVSGGPR